MKRLKQSFIIFVAAIQGFLGTGKAMKVLATNDISSSIVSCSEDEFTDFEDIIIEGKEFKGNELVYRLVEDGVITEKEFDYLLSVSWHGDKKQFFMYDLNTTVVHIEEEVETLEFLIYFKNLDILSISNCKDFSYLKNLNVSKLNFSDSNISSNDLKYIPKSVKELSFSGNCENLTKITNIKDYCPQLEEFYLTTNNTVMISDLPSSLTRLNVKDSTALEEIKGLDKCDNLESVDLRECSKLSDLSFLTQLSCLKRVYMEGCNITQKNKEYLYNYLSRLEIEVDFEPLFKSELIDNANVVDNAIKDRVNIEKYNDDELIINTNIFPKMIQDILVDNVGKELDKVTFGDLKYISNLGAIKADFKNLDFLYYIPNISCLNILTSVEDISALKYTKLEKLILNYTAINDEQLVNIPNTVRYLDLSDSVYLTDLSILTKTLPHLKELTINRCGNIKSLDFVADFSELDLFVCKELTCVDEKTLEKLNNTGIKHTAKIEDVTNHNKIKTIVASLIKEGMTDSEKVNAIVAYVNKHMRYSQGEMAEDQTSPLTFALQGKGVCRGFSYLTNALLNEAGLNAYCLMPEDAKYYGDGSYGHALNLIFLDGKWVIIEPQRQSENEITLDELAEDYGDITIAKKILHDISKNENKEKLNMLNWQAMLLSMGVLGTVSGGYKTLKRIKEEES